MFTQIINLMIFLQILSGCGKNEQKNRKRGGNEKEN